MMVRNQLDAGAYSHSLEGGFDPYYAFVSSVPRFIDLARQAAETQAVSHRNFHVGAVLYAGVSALSRVAVIDGANTKPTEESPKYCAEMNVLDQARGLGLTSAVGIVVAGTSDPERIKSVSGIATPTLHPCGECRAKMDESGLFEDSSLVITVSTEEDFYEAHTYAEMKAFWRDPFERDFATSIVRYDPDRWHWHQAAYGRNMAEVPDSQPWDVARFALQNSVISRD